MERATLSEKISYRLTDEDWRLIEAEAGLEGISVNDWCRNAAIEKIRGRNRIFARGESLIYEELSRVRYLLGHGLRLLANDSLTPQEWQKLRQEADKNPAQIAEALLSKAGGTERS